MYHSLAPGSQSFQSVIFLFTVYYIIERGLRRLSRIKNPDFYQGLLSTRKDLPYFGIAMGFLITLFSAPACGYAACTAVYPWHAKPESNEAISGMVSTSGTICVVSRGILWVSELNRLGEHNFYLYHHLGSLVSLTILLAIQIPLGAVYAIYAGLLSELAGDLVWLGNAHGYTAENSSWFRRLDVVNTVQYVVFRAPGVIFGFYFTLNAGLSPLEQLICTSFLAVYTAFIIYCFFKRASKIGWLYVVSEHPAHIRVGDYIFTAYGAFMGFGLASLATGAVALYSDINESSEVAAAIGCILLCSVLGARLLSLIFEDGFTKLVSDPVLAICRPGFWLHGGIFGAGVGILLSRDSILRPLDMIAALGITLPLFETFSRLGCHSYGCCFGRRLSPSEISGTLRPFIWRFLPVPIAQYNSHAAAAVRLHPELRSKPLFPIQLISAALFALQFTGIMMLLLTGCMSITYAGWSSLVLHAVVRIITEQFRGDFRGDIGDRDGGSITITSALAGVQVLIGSLGIAVIRNGKAPHLEGRFAQVGWDKVGSVLMDRNVFYCASFAFALGFTVYGYNFRKIGAWVDRG